MNSEAIKYVVLGALLGGVVTWGVLCYVKPSSNERHEALSMSQMTGELRDKSGDEFDEAFIDMMIVHHQGAIDMAQLIPSHAKHEEIKKLGQDIISAQTKEINEMKAWAKEWGYDNKASSGHMMDH